MWLLTTVMCLPLVGCSVDDEDDSDDIVREKRVMKKETFEFTAFRKEGVYLVGYSPAKRPSTFCRWSAAGCNFIAFLYQDGRLHYIGNFIHSKETSLNDNQREMELTYEVPLPTSIDPTRDYGAIAFSAEVETALVNNRITCNADLKRDYRGYIWDDDTHKAVSDHSMGGGAICHSRSVMTIEGLYVYNNTADTITIKHKGFEAAEKWYYTKATVNMATDLSIETKGTSTYGDVTSEIRKVAPSNKLYITSKYVPTGNKMTDARLVLEINGKEVKTEPISSNVEIKYAEYYEMEVNWNGEKLEWITEH